MVLTEDIRKSSIYEMKINNGEGKMGLSEYHGKVSEVHKRTDLEKCCDKNMSRPLNFKEQEAKIGTKEFEEITSEEGKDAITTGLFRENFEQDLTRSDEDLLDILADLGKENNVIKVDINEGLNGSNVGDKFPKVVPTETDQNKTVMFNDSSVSEKNSKTKSSITEDDRLEGYFCSKTVFNLSKKILTETEIKVLKKGLDFEPIQKTLNEPEFRKDFEEFSHRMRCKWNFAK